MDDWNFQEILGRRYDLEDDESSRCFDARETKAAKPMLTPMLHKERRKKRNQSLKWDRFLFHPIFF